MGLKKLVSDLTQGLKAYPNHNQPSTSGGFNYGKSTSIFDTRTFRQRSLKYDVGKATEHQDNPVPLVTIDLPGVNDEKNHRGFLSGVFNNPIGNFIDGVSDGFVRGGLQFATRRSFEDTKRIGKFFLSANGIGFIASQVALQRTNPLIQETAGDGLIGKLGGFLQNTIGTDLGIGNINRVYSPLNTLAQIPLSATGKHLDRAGLLPVRPEKGKYQYTVATSGNKDTGGSAYAPETNRLLFLSRELGFTSPLDSKIDTPEQGGGLFGNTKFGSFISNAKSAIKGGIKQIKSALGLPSSADLPPVLYKYSGGPDSLYGIGETSIRRYYDSSHRVGINSEGQPTKILLDKNGINVISEANLDPMMMSPNSYGKELYMTNEVGKLMTDVQPSQKLGANFIGHYGDKHTKPKWKGDSNQDLRSTYLNNIAALEGTNVKRREDRFNMGDVGQGFHRFKNGKLDITKQSAATPTIDRINALDILKTGDGSDISLNDPALKDMIRFRIEAINSDNPLQAETMVFRAFLDDWSDQYDAGWNSFKYNGRGEEFYTYDSFKRTVSFSFKIAAQSRGEMMPLYRKLNYLVSQTAPDYRNLRMRGNFVKISIGDLLDRTPGIITSIGLKWQKDYSWEIANDEQDTDMLVLPHVLDVSVSFTPIHSFLPQKGVRDVDGNLKSLSPFILPSKINDNNLPTTKDWTTKGAVDSIPLTNSATPSDQGKADNIKEEDPTGEKQGENNIKQTPDSTKASETTSANSSNNNTHTGPPLVAVVDETSTPSVGPENNPQVEPDTSSEEAAKEVTEANTAEEAPIIKNPQPDSQYPGGSMEAFYKCTEDEPHGIYNQGYDSGEIYNTNHSDCATGQIGSGDAPILRARITCTLPDGTRFSNEAFACGIEQADPVYGMLLVNWQFGQIDVWGKTVALDKAISCRVEAKGMNFSTKVQVGYITHGKNNSKDQQNFFTDAIRTAGGKDSYNNAYTGDKIMKEDFSDRVTLAKKLAILLEEKGKMMYPDYKVEIG